MSLANKLSSKHRMQGIRLVRPCLLELSLMNRVFIDGMLCIQCGHVYEPAKGCPSLGVATGTSWEAVPHDWRCPDCGCAKGHFESVEIIYQRAYCVLAEC
jgi:rubredoxin